MACEGAWSGSRDQGSRRAPSGPSLSSASPPRTLSGSQGGGPASGYGGGPSLRGQGGCGAVAPWPPLLRVLAHRVLASASVESAPPPPLVRGTAAARLLATDGSDPAKKLSLRPPSVSLPATSVSLAAAEPAKKPSSASIVVGGPSQCNQPAAGAQAKGGHLSTAVWVGSSAESSLRRASIRKSSKKRGGPRGNHRPTARRPIVIVVKSTGAPAARSSRVPEVACNS